MIKRADVSYGIIAMGLFIVWMNFLPFYGPGFYALEGISLSAPYLFVALHIIGLLYGSWLYYYNPEHILIVTTSKSAPSFIAIMTILVYFHTIIGSAYNFILLFSIMGLLSGFLVSRWMVWFTSDVTASKRGSIFGKTVGLTYIILSVIIAFSSYSGNYLYGFIISALAVLIGGFLLTRLPVPKSQKKMPSIFEIIPPLDLLLFAAVSYTFISLLYDMIFYVNVHKPLIGLWVIILYLLICLILGRLSDSKGRFFFPILALFLAGLGFLAYLFAPLHNLVNFLVDPLISSALLCIHLYYWLSLVDRQSINRAQFYLPVGVSFELLIFSIFYSIFPLININLENTEMVAGVSGLVLVLIGFIITIYSLYKSYFKKNAGLIKEEAGCGKGYSSNTGSSIAKINALIRFNEDSEKEIGEVLSYHYKLTPREIEVAKLLFTGHSNEEIKGNLSISMNTVKFHIRNIYSKIGVSKRNEAAEIVCAIMEKRGIYS